MLTCAEYTRKALHLVSGSSTFRLLCTCTVLYLSCVLRFSQPTKGHPEARKISKCLRVFLFPSRTIFFCSDIFYAKKGRKKEREKIDSGNDYSTKWKGQ